MPLAAVVEDRCDRCTRDDLLSVAVVEAARHFMAWQLRDERAGRAGIFASSTIPTAEVVDALQTLRDSLAAERRARSGR